MLTDWRETEVRSGGLDRTIHKPNTWLLTLLAFIAEELPKWRDDPVRPSRTAETELTSQLIAHLNSATHHSRGWDFLQFRTEEPDETTKGRKVDLIPAPRAATVWVDGREYNQYSTLIPIECKRLPTPPGSDRDKREYLFSRYSSTGGVQRFKAGHHGAAHNMGAMIAYIQGSDIGFWIKQLQSWIEELVADETNTWGNGDGLSVVSHDHAIRLATLESKHQRISPHPDIHLHHLWIEMPTTHET
ncbi:MAG: hypothetical protein ACPGU7_11035 [Gammaproteobacteria bacterium]